MLQKMRSAAKYLWIFIALCFVGGFLLVETSGLLGRTAVTPTTAVARVNGHEILYNDYMQRWQSELQNQQQQSGRSLSEDEIRQIQNNVFDQMVMDILLQQEYQRRGIIVTDDEIQQYAKFAPPPWIMQAPELQTEGRFDIQKYQRLLASAQARQSGLLASLEQYYRTQIPRQKLMDQVTSGIYVTDAELWRSWQDQHDSAQVSFVSFPARPDSAILRSISDASLQEYFDKHKDELKRPGRAVLSVVSIPRVVSAADSEAVRQHAVALRNEILGGAKFEDVAKRESADTATGAKGGELGKGGRGRFVPEFETAAYALKPGEISQPVLTQFGYHLIRVNERKGDTLDLSHILLRIQPSDSSEARIDRNADSLSKLAASSEQGAKLDTAARKLGLTVMKVVATEDQPAVYDGKLVPSVSAWAFGGAHVGETSELFDDESGYYLARLDSLRPGGEPNFDIVKGEIRERIATERSLDQLTPRAQQLASNAARTSLESAAAQEHLTVQHSPMFTRAGSVPGLGQFNAAIGAAFGLPVGAVGAPVRTSDALAVERVDKRVLADSAAWLKQKDQQRQARMQQLQQQRVQMFLQDLKQTAKIDDRRKEINQAVRRGGEA
ncbi:MAG TPA: peptidyl-prolyl cis-trans isomerase [Gemmatimonadaceae bacterium]|nr:peptidyl-prolyl cis-trans isomerase [Gemmatimonadaceae bacterium]